MRQRRVAGSPARPPLTTVQQVTPPPPVAPGAWAEAVRAYEAGLIGPETVRALVARQREVAMVDLGPTTSAKYKQGDFVTLKNGIVGYPAGSRVRIVDNPVYESVWKYPVNTASGRSRLWVWETGIVDPADAEPQDAKPELPHCPGPNVQVHCIKCRTFQAQRAVTYAERVPGYAVEGLRWACRYCGYTWYTRCADAE